MSDVPTEPAPELEVADDAPTSLTLNDMLATGASYRQIDYWTRVGYLTPERGLPGSGYSRQWSERDRQMAHLIVRLSRLGLEVPKAADYARDLLDNGAPVFRVADGLVLTIEWEEPA